MEQVRSRIDRDRQRLDGGMVNSPRELENLQSEVVSLQRRQSDLEEVVLDVMERREAAESSLDQATSSGPSSPSELGQRHRHQGRGTSRAGEQFAKASRPPRPRSSPTLPADLLDLYDKLRTQHGGRRARPRCVQRSCQGCNLTMNTVDLNAIRSAPDDEVLRCEECRRILVRTADSGL